MAQDLTKDEAQRAQADEEGTGIDWFIDPTGRPQKMFIPGITRARARELATDFERPGKQELDAYRWVPDYIRADFLVTTECGGRCDSDVTA